MDMRHSALRLAGEPSPDMPVGDERWKVPPSLGAMLQPLEPLHRPSGPLYLAQTAAVTEPQGSPAELSVWTEPDRCR